MGVPRVLDALSPKVRRRAANIMAKARAKSHVQVLKNLTEAVGDERRIIEEAPLIVRETHTAAAAQARLRRDRPGAPFDPRRPAPA
ncbi:MAG: hypothetical protein Q8M19_01100 [Reyranella sp.]|nr:hypothetical protein [Reyranella sp.]